MTTFVARRVARGLLTLWLVVSAVFVGGRLSGDPIYWLLPDDASPRQASELRARLGLDRPLAEQYVRFLRGLGEGDFGLSYRERRPVAEMFAERVPATLRLAILAFALSLAIGVPAGIVAALRRNGPVDRIVMGITFVGQALPNYVLGIALILVFSLALGWLPSGGRGGGAHLVLPVVTLGTASAAALARLARSGMLDVLRQDYMRTARAKGLPPLRVIVKHGLRNGFLPVLTIVGLQVGTLVGGSVIVETVFAWPGMGRLVVTAVAERDFPVLQFAVLVVSATVVLANTLVDVLYGAFDPRLRGA